jgi:hypothetical protein
LGQGSISIERNYRHSADPLLQARPRAGDLRSRDIFLIGVGSHFGALITVLSEDQNDPEIVRPREEPEDGSYGAADSWREHAKRGLAAIARKHRSNHTDRHGGDGLGGVSRWTGEAALWAATPWNAIASRLPGSAGTLCARSRSGLSSYKPTRIIGAHDEKLAADQVGS